MKKIIKKGILVTLLIIFGSNCNQNNKNLETLILGYTQGLISNNEEIKIFLLKKVTSFKIGDIIPEEIINFSSNTKGKLILKNNTYLSFIPQELFPSDKEIKVDLNLQKLYKEKISLKNINFKVKTLPQTIDLKFQGIEINNTKNKDNINVKAKVSFNDFVKYEDLNNIVSVKFNNEKPKLKWLANENSKNKEFTFLVENLQRKEGENDLLLAYNGNILNSKEKKEERIMINSHHKFQLIKIEKNYENENGNFTAYFNNQIKKDILKEGLFSLVNKENQHKDIKVLINKTDIKIVPKDVLEEGKYNLLAYSHITDNDNKNLNENINTEVEVSKIEPQLMFLGSGSILPSTDGLYLPFKSVGLKSINVKIVKIPEKNLGAFFQVNDINNDNNIGYFGRVIFHEKIELKKHNDKTDLTNFSVFKLDLSKYINVEKGAIYRIGYSFGPEDILRKCNINYSQQINYNPNFNESDNINEIKTKKEGYYDYENDEYVKNNNSYFMEYGHMGHVGGEDYNDENYDTKKNDPCNRRYYEIRNNVISKNIYASDIGLIAKGFNDKKLSIVATDLVTAKPIPNLDIEFYNFQNFLVGTAKTDKNGFLTYNTNSNKIYLIVAKNENQKGYLRVDDTKTLALNMFDINGENLPNDNLKGFLYGERDVWRPGDSIFIGLILNNINKLPENYPFFLDVFDPDGANFGKFLYHSKAGNLVVFKFATTPKSTSGYWTAQININSTSLELPIRIETIKPNRLKIEFSENIDLTNLIVNKFKLQVKWLHGAIAEKLNYELDASLVGVNLVFKKFNNFVFDVEDFNNNNYFKEPLNIKGELNEEGTAEIETFKDITEKLPGKLKLGLYTKVFEKGGDFSIDKTDFFIYPYSSYVGIERQNGRGWFGAIPSNKTSIIKICNLTKNGELNKKPNKIKVEIYKHRDMWWWESNNTDLNNLIINETLKLVSTEEFTTKNGYVNYNFNLNEKYFGKLVIKVTDLASNHYSILKLLVDYEDFIPPQIDENTPAELEVKLDKLEYKVNDNINITIPSQNDSRILVYVESGDSIYQKFWVQGQDKKTVITLKAENYMAPNAYLTLFLIQPHSQLKNDMPIRMLGIKPLLVYAPITKLEPVITAPEINKTDETFEIKINEKEGKKMNYTLAIVDEGILNLTKFRTPNPWPNFFKKQALKINNWDLYNNVIGRYVNELDEMIGIGGSDYINANEVNNNKRFLPVVKFLGPFSLKENQTATHNITINNYYGECRIMVVATNEENAYGSADKSTLIKTPIMVFPTATRILSPEDEMDLPITIFVSDTSIKSIKVNLNTSNIFENTGDNSNILKIDNTGEYYTKFKIKTKNIIGSGKIEITAQGNNEFAKSEIYMTVRPPNPIVSETESFILEPSNNNKLEIITKGIENSIKGKIEFSQYPSLKLEKRLNYLIQYPHGCIEQTTSSVYPQLYLDNLTNLDENQIKTIDDNIKASFERLKLFQLTNGGFTFWPNSQGENASEFGTNYAGNFIVEAQKKGFILPQNMLNKWISFQNSLANLFSSNEHYDLFNQAYRLYTLALANSPNLAAMNILLNNKNINRESITLLCAAYALAGERKVAEDLLNKYYTIPIADRNSDYYNHSYGSATRDKAFLLNTHTILKLKEKGKDLFFELSKEVGMGEYMSTQTLATSLIAISNYIGKEPQNVIPKVEYNFKKNNYTKELNNNINSYALENLTLGNNGELYVKNNGQKTIFVDVTLSFIPKTSDVKFEKHKGLKTKIEYFSINGPLINTELLEAGQSFIASVSVSHSGIKENFENLALTQIFPSGWEINNIRLTNIDNPMLVSSASKYQDIRDDRIYTYFHLNKNETKTFKVLLTATYSGKYFYPSLFLEDMYDNNVESYIPGKWVEVTRK